MISRFVKPYLIAFGAIMLIGTIIVALYTPRLGLEFTGGTLTEVRYENAPSLDVLTSDLDILALEHSLESYSLRETEFEDGASGAILRARELSESERIAVQNTLTARDASSTVTRYTAVGSVIGKELIDKAWWAIGAILLSIVLYVAYVFRHASGTFRSSLFGIVTVVVLLHDLLVPTAVLSLLGVFAGAEIDILFVIALLATLGYSVNDTVVIFDRVREELHRDTEKETKRTLGSVVDTAVRKSIGRSLNTSLTTAIVLMALYLFGSPVTMTFALILIAGVIAGTYSSFFIANPLLLVLADKFKLPETTSVVSEDM